MMPLDYARNSSRLPLWVAALAAVLLLCSSAPVCAAADSRTLSKEWTNALKPLHTLPVQQLGYVRSGLTYAQRNLQAISGKRSYSGQPALTTILWLLADKTAANELPLLKVDFPDLAKFFRGKMITLKTYRDPANREKMMGMYNANPKKFEDPINSLEWKAQQLEDLAMTLAIVPREGEWLAPIQLHPMMHGGASAPAPDPLDGAILEQWTALKAALVKDDPKSGAEAARKLAENVAKAAAERKIETPHLRLDYTYQKHHPFMKSAFLYLFAALCYLATVLFGWRRLAWAGYAFLTLGFLEEVFGIVCRWILAGRAPLSNMYESFTFATAGMILVALIFEATNRIHLAGLGGAILGALFMALAHNLPIFDSKISPLMPALNSVWLTYHVVTIMLSYSAFALSFFVSVCYLGKDVLGGDGSRIGLIKKSPSLATLDVFNYKIIAVGFPLLTVGIVLGAVWANTAWGRAWGFDPKETWSAITWLVYAGYLHVRFIAGWKGRRAAFVALFGFACVLFTYFGVNYLEVFRGLHSYS